MKEDTSEAEIVVTKDGLAMPSADNPSKKRNETNNRNRYQNQNLNQKQRQSRKVNIQSGEANTVRSNPISVSPRVKYKARQVVVRDSFENKVKLPIGTNIVGKLLTAIDSRDSGKLIKIELPFGGSFKGKELIAKKSILFANFTYPGEGKKVYLNIHSGVEPDGSEFEINAHVLNSKEFSPGLIGEFHGTFSNRVASTLGLSFVSGVTEILQERESLGNSYTVTPKATLKNAGLHGISKVTDMEARRQAQELEDKAPHVTVEAERELIVTLSKTFKRKVR